jgi:intracellular sulfur oxidation DsrE/DsrF family protein
MKKFIAPLLVVLVGLAMAFHVSSADGTDHKVVVHVDENDPARMNLALNNVANVKKYYDSKGETIEIELVAYGPGLHMFRADTSPVKDRLSVMALEIDNLTFSACGNTHSKMSKKAGKDITLVDEATMVPSGVVQIIELQEQGYAYVRP